MRVNVKLIKFVHCSMSKSMTCLVGKPFFWGEDFAVETLAGYLA